MGTYVGNVYIRRPTRCTNSY
jgi:hypothetical protein